jgi:hypothetical protein
MAGIDTAPLDPGLKRGSAELLIPSLLDARRRRRFYKVTAERRDVLPQQRKRVTGEEHA